MMRPLAATYVQVLMALLLPAMMGKMRSSERVLQYFPYL
jgi:hypothetical protein